MDEQYVQCLLERSTEGGGTRKMAWIQRSIAEVGNKVRFQKNPYISGCLVERQKWDDRAWIVKYVFERTVRPWSDLNDKVHEGW